jgi:glycosyltransferase involved in cell wall biosynthesis
MRTRYRVAFFMQQVLGHATHSAGLERLAREDPEVDEVWVPVSYWRDGGRIERLPALPTGAKGVLRAAAQVRSVLARSDLDGIVFNSPALATLSVRSISRVPTTISLDVTPRQFDREAIHFGHRPDGRGPIARMKHRWNRHLFENCAALAPWSTWARDSLEADYGVDPSVVAVIPPGVDVDEWRPLPVERRELPQVLFVGGDFRRKGGDLLLAWFRSRGRGLCELQIVSRDSALDGEDAPDIHVHRGFAPNDQKLRRLYWGSDVFVLPSRSEPFGIAAVEALAAGRPVVASAVGGLTDIVEHGVNGYLVEPDDPRSLGAAIEFLLESPTRRRVLGENGMRMAAKRFNADTNGRRLLELVKGGVESRRRSAPRVTSEAMTR